MKNEADNLRRFHESIKGIFDQYVLVDTGSTDDTVKIAHELGYEVHHFEWINDFAAARNFAMSKLKTDFGFWMDGDDVLDNAEKFLAFKNDIMNLGDFWVAPYHYASDKNGVPNCTFIRERVIRLNRGMQWKYFLHEGIPPVGNAPIRVLSTEQWCIRHMRTDDDMKKDRSRNIKIMEHHKLKGLDPRMQYYYGKELFEADQPVEAANELTRAAASGELEQHDRVLTYQYAAWAYMKCNQFPKAMEMAYLGLMVNPHRAEYHCIIGDCHLKLNNLVGAIPHFVAAKACIQNNAATAPIFSNTDCYGLYPANMLTRIYAQMGDLDKAQIEAQWSASKGSEEGIALLAEVTRLKEGSLAYKTGKPCDDIVISTAPQNAYEWDADIAKTKAMGGSETAAIEMAYWLHKLSGRKVKVFNMRQNDVVCDGVEYISNNKLMDYMKDHKPWLHIAWRHNIKVTEAPTFLWCHDLFTQGAENTANYVKHLCLTPFHKKWVMANQKLPEDKIFVTRNGIKPERFTNDLVDKDPFKFVFPNSPDRGLDRVMLVLDEVRKTHPKVTLDVFYGIEHLPRYNHQALHDKLKIMMEERKEWVTYKGATQQDELMKAFRGAAYWLSPSDWIETSCISAMELVGCGVYPIFRGIGGVVDTLAPFVSDGMATQVNGEAVTPEELVKFVDATNKAISEEAYKRVKFNPEMYSWKKVAESWLESFPKLM